MMADPHGGSVISITNRTRPRIGRKLTFSGCSKWDEAKCKKAHGTFNSHECTCQYPDPCAEKRSECSKHGWGCNDRCECVAPAHEKVSKVVCYYSR